MTTVSPTQDLLMSNMAQSTLRMPPSVYSTTALPQRVMPRPYALVEPSATGEDGSDLNEVSSTPAMPAVAPLMVPNTPPPVPTKAETVNEKALATQVEDINEALIALGHGRAFQWLSDTESGYREYMQELLALRDATAKGVTADVLPTLEARIMHLREMAENVAKRVAPGTALEMGKPAVPPAALPKAAAEVPPPPALEAMRVPPTRSSVDAMPFATPESLIKTPVPQNVKEEMIADVAKTEAVPEMVAPVMAKAPAPSADDALYTNGVDARLNDLLVNWLGSTGFLGFGDSGMKHPQWVAMRGLALDTVIEDDGTVPPGLEFDVLKNLRENIRTWKEQYDLISQERETVEHFVRRVVLVTSGGMS